MINKNLYEFVRHNFLRTSLVLSLFLFLGLGIYGTIEANWWSTSVWNSSNNEIMFLYFCISVVSLFYILIRLGIPFLSLFLIPLGSYVCIAGMGPLFAVIWIWLSANSIGNVIIKFVSKNYQSQHFFRCAVVGFSFIGISINLLVYLNLCTPMIVLSLFTLPIILNVMKEKSIFGKADLKSAASFKLHGFYEEILGVIVLLGFSLLILVTYLPDVGHDALSVHLNIPEQILRSGGWSFDVKKYVWAVMPFGADWLFVPPYFFSGEQGARLLNSSMVFAIAVCGFTMLQRRVGILLSLGFSALLLTLPMSTLEVASTFVEAPLAFFLFMSIHELIEQNKNGKWYILTIILGYACSIKLIAILILPFIVFGAMFQSQSKNFEIISIKKLILLIPVFLIFSLPPYLLAYLKTGNPVFPFFNTIFLSPYFDTITSFTNPLYVRLMDYRIWWDMSINSKNFGEFSGSGALGITILVLGPFSVMVAIAKKRYDVFAFSAVILIYILLCFKNQAYLRYIFPVITWIILLGMWSISKIPINRFLATAIICLFSLFHLARFPVVYWPLQQFDLNWLKNKNFIELYFRQNKPEAIAGEVLQKMGEFNNSTIAILGLNPTYKNYPDNTVADSWHSWGYLYPARNDKYLIQSLYRSNVEVIVFPVGRGYRYESEALAISTEIFRIGDVRVGKIDLTKKFTVEKIVDSDFSTGSDLWMKNGAIKSNNGWIVTKNTPIVQAVSVVGIDKMLLTLEAKCPLGKYFRTQVNWEGMKGDSQGVDLKVHECSPDGIVISRILTKPEKAVTALVYGGSHDESPIIITKLSLKSAKPSDNN